MSNTEVRVQRTQSAINCVHKWELIVTEIRSVKYDPGENVRNMESLCSVTN